MNYALNEEVLAFTRRVYLDKLDKVGLPSLLHPLTVGIQARSYAKKANLPNEDYYEVAGYLHDVLEDKLTTAGVLQSLHLPLEVYDAVIGLTHRPSLAYEDYIHGIAQGSIIPIVVKLCDIEHNISRPRFAEFKLEQKLAARNILQRAYKEYMNEKV